MIDVGRPIVGKIRLNVTMTQRRARAPVALQLSSVPLYTSCTKKSSIFNLKTHGAHAAGFGAGCSRLLGN